MVQQYDITELGESLVERTRTNREKTYKRQRQDAWKIALAQTGVNFINRSLQKKADEFLMSEEAMAVKGRYKANAEQASRIINMRNAAQEQGKTMQQYFFDSTYLPEITAQFQSKYGNDFKPEDYASQIREKAWELANQEAAEFEVALDSAMKVPAWEEVSGRLDQIISPPRTAGEALLGKVKGLWTGQSSDDIRRDILKRIDDEGRIFNDSIQSNFDRILKDDGISKAREFVDSIDTTKMRPNDRIIWSSNIVDNPNGSIIVKEAFVHKANGDIIPFSDVSDMEGAGLEIIELKDWRTITSEDDMEERRLEMIRHSDVYGSAEDILTPEGLAQFHNQLREAGIDASNYYEKQNYGRFNQIFQTISSDAVFVKNPELIDSMTTIMAAILQTDTPNLFQALTATDGIGEEGVRNYFNELFSALGDIRRLVNSPLIIKDYNNPQ